MKTLPAWGALIVGLIATVFLSLQVKQASEKYAVGNFAFICDQVTLKIQERLDACALILRGGAGLFAASATVDRNAWRAYVSTLRAQGTIRGVQGVGFSKLIAPDQLSSHIAEIRNEGFPGYAVRPSGERAPYTSIIYLEPFRDRNLRAFGYDMFSEPVRRAAMEHARDTGEAALSGKVVLVQETSSEVQAGTLLYVPVYRNGAPADTVAQRREALVGWVYSPYRMADFIGDIVTQWEHHFGKDMDMHIFAGNTATPANLIFDGDPATTPNPRSLFYQQRMVVFGGQTWLLAFDLPLTLSPVSYASTWGTLAGGISLSCLLCGLLLSQITTKSRAERIARELTAELERFTYTVSHDLKSPLVTIKTFLGYLEQDMRNHKADEVSKDLGFIHHAADKMGELLGELLQLARVGHKVSSPEDVSLQEIVQEALSLVAGQIAERGVQVIVTQEPVWLRGDRLRLVEVFQNLIDNAVKFSGDQSAPKVEIGVEQVGGALAIFVRDNGKGIVPTYQHKLFGLFDKYDASSPGSGLGLALVRRIVDLHGGRIWVQSEGLGHGATFWLTLAHTRLQTK